MLNTAQLHCSLQWGIPALRSTMVGRALSDEWHQDNFIQHKMQSESKRPRLPM